MKIRVKAKLMEGAGFWLMVAIALIDELIDLIDTLFTLAPNILGGIIGAAAGASAAGGVATDIVCYYDTTCFMLGDATEFVAGILGAVGGGFLGGIAGPLFALLIQGMSFVISLFVGFTIIFYYFWKNVKMQERILAITAIAIIIELLPIINGFVPATVISLFAVRHFHNKEQNKKKKTLLSKVARKLVRLTLKV